MLAGDTPEKRSEDWMRKGYKQWVAVIFLCGMMLWTPQVWASHSVVDIKGTVDPETGETTYTGEDMILVTNPIYDIYSDTEYWSFYPTGEPGQPNALGTLAGESIISGQPESCGSLQMDKGTVNWEDIVLRT